MLFCLTKMRIIQSNHGVFKSFAINQSESSITYEEFLKIFLISTNQNRASMVMKFSTNLMSTNQN